MTLHQIECFLAIVREGTFTHFHVIHDEGRPLSASAAARARLLEAEAKTKR